MNIRPHSFAFNLIYGLYSGFPLCCVSLFSRLADNKLVHEHMEEKYGADHHQTAYVRCLNCRNASLGHPPFTERLDMQEAVYKLWPWVKELEEEDKIPYSKRLEKRGFYGN